MADLLLADQAARDAVVEELDTCFLVEAGAGSGKTYSMVQRMVALIKEGKCRVENMAAVTFTRKAAAELKERFQLVLEKTLITETAPESRKRLEEALCNLDRCFLGTIHSFCAALLRERPIEAGLDPGFQELDELEDALLQNKVWEDYLVNVRQESPYLLENLAKVDIEAGELRDCFKMLLVYPDVEVASGPVPPPELHAARVALFELLDYLGGFMPKAAPPKGWDSLQSMLRMAQQRKKFLDLSDDLILLRLFADLDKKAGVTQNRWRCKDDALCARDEFDSFREDIIIPVLRAWREHRYHHILQFIKPAAALYTQRKKEQSRLNFQDLLMHTAALLRENPTVRRYFQERYTHLLIDEFQDTDPIQAEVMFYLTGTEVDEKRWHRLRPRPGSLFVVGDPKQSIYRFRRADIDTYNQVKKLLVQGSGRVLYFTTNFRSVQAVGDFANLAFENILPEETTSYQAAFSRMDTLHPNEEGAAFGVRKISLAKVPRNRLIDIVRADAAKIAGWIRGALDGDILLTRTVDELSAGLTPIPVPADFMIILRYKAHMEEYARALEDRGIPFQIAGGGGFAQSDEIRELLKVFGAILDPDNPVHLAAALRGSFYGISDRQLWLFKKAGGRFNYLSGLPEGLAQNEQELFAWAFGQLRCFRQWARELPGGVAIEKIISELGIVPYAFSGELGKSRSGYIMQAVELIAAAERGGTTSFAELVGYLELLREVGVEEEINIAPWELNAVRLMNLHKAKGLEAPVVFLANPGKRVEMPPSVHINRVGDTPRGHFIFEKKKVFTSEILGQPVDWDRHAQTEQLYLEAEEQRLLYVAATRAKNLLVVSTYPSKPDSSPWLGLDGHLGDAGELVDETADGPLCGTPDRFSDRALFEPVGEGPAGESPAGMQDESLVLLAEFAQARQSFLAQGSKANTPSYNAVAVTELVKDGVARPAWLKTGRGMSWGRVIHRALESSVRGSFANLELLVENIMAEEGRDPQGKEEVLTLVDNILKSPLWQRMLQSAHRYTEVPFSVGSVGDKAGPEGGMVVSGVIDLVFKENRGWVLVDYKTDTIQDDAMFEELVSYYTPQVRLYKGYWERLTGEKVHEAGLYFTDCHRWVTV